MTITVGTNSYVADATFVSYLAQSVRGSALTTTAARREAALVTALHMLQRLVYEGDQLVAYPTQVLAFPRTGLTDRYDDAVSSATVPVDVTYAQMELAIELLINSGVEASMSGGPNGNVRRVKAGTAEVEFFSPFTSGFGQGRLPPSVMQLIAQFLASSDSTTAAGGFDFGTDGETNFEDDDLFNYSEPL